MLTLPLFSFDIISPNLSNKLCDIWKFIVYHDINESLSMSFKESGKYTSTKVLHLKAYESIDSTFPDSITSSNESHPEKTLDGISRFTLDIETDLSSAQFLNAWSKSEQSFSVKLVMFESSNAYSSIEHDFKVISVFPFANWHLGNAE